MHRQSSIPFNQSGIGVRAITMTAKTAPANAAAPITAAVFLLRFFFTALQISMAQTTQTAATASAITSVSHNHESSYNILIRSPYLSPANWKLLFHIHAFVKFRFIVPFRRTCAAFLLAISGTVGKGLERETLCPFPRLRRFGTHYETGSKFLLLFSIKSKDGMLCFAVKALNGRTANVG